MTSKNVTDTQTNTLICSNPLSKQAILWVVSISTQVSRSLLTMPDISLLTMFQPLKHSTTKSSAGKYSNTSVSLCILEKLSNVFYKSLLFRCITAEKLLATLNLVSHTGLTQLVSYNNHILYSDLFFMFPCPLWRNASYWYNISTFNRLFRLL